LYDHVAPVTHPAADSLVSRVGLCLSCRHADVITSSRESTFYRCRRSETDPTFRKYPALPVVACRGYEPDATS
jgi:hypothetical protein